MPASSVQTLQPLVPPDSHFLRAAQGWLELGSPLEAEVELEGITPASRAHPAVLEIRFQICAAAQKWDVAAEIARELVQISPEEPQFWISQAYATRRTTGGGIAQAKDILDKAQALFPKVWTIPYNLACYCAQLGRLDEAQEWFKRALAIDERTVKRTAIDDPDLKPLRDGMSGTLWKKTE
jgi:tetratricopeptide (TPR) repeat protein